MLELIRAHRSTLIFVNSRRLAERLAARLNELAGEELVRAHHGSVAREQRLEIEEQLKAGKLPALVATSSLELGIDMGAIDLVVQIESPPSVASGMQRIGRAGHQVGEPSTGKIFPKFRGDLVEAAVVVERMKAAAIEETRIPRNPLDVLAQQIVAICALDRWTVDDLHRLVTRAESFRDLSREQLTGVLDMLSGRYPSDEFADLKPRVVWDRQTDEVASRNDARVVAITSGGTIPDRGLFGVFLPGDDGGRGGRRVGEMDEEWVYESRVGETFLLGASTWRIEEILPDRLIVTPAPGEPGKMPFWHGDAIGRPIELGRAIGAFLRELEPMAPEAAMARLRDSHALDELAARNLVGYLADQREVTGVLPTDRTIVVERFRDELGDWRVALLTPFGGRVHAPWAMAIEARLREHHGVDVQAMWSDDGIAVRLPEGIETDGSTIESALLLDPDEIEELLDDRAGWIGAVRRPLPRERRSRAVAAAASPRAAHAAVDAAPEVGRPAFGGEPLRVLPDHPRDLPRGACATSSTCRRWSSCSARSARGGFGSSASSRGRPRRSPRRCSSTTSGRSCTRAMRRWANAGPRRSPSTAICLPSCSEPRSCAS